MIFEWDDFGCNHEISASCQSHDCRDMLLRLKEVNPKFKATLFTIPGELTEELLQWAMMNADWIRFAWHGFFHDSNWECEKMSYETFDDNMQLFSRLGFYFENVFRAPGWQISDDIFRWLKDHDWVVADQDYNTPRRPVDLKAYINRNGVFFSHQGGDGDWTEEDGYHGHTWNVGALGGEPNGIYEDFEKVKKLVAEATEFKFVSELFK